MTMADNFLTLEWYFEKKAQQSSMVLFMVGEYYIECVRKIPKAIRTRGWPTQTMLSLEMGEKQNEGIKQTQHF